MHTLYSRNKDSGVGTREYLYLRCGCGAMLFVVREIVYNSGMMASLLLRSMGLPHFKQWLIGNALQSVCPSTLLPNDTRSELVGNFLLENASSFNVKCFTETYQVL